MKVLVVFYSMYGHVFKMAEAAAVGVKLVEGIEVVVRRVPETLSDEILEEMGALKAKEKMEKIPLCALDELKEADGIIFCTPTRFGNMCGQMRQFLDSTGGLWMDGAL
ncbi:MAG: NAD(P)H-dependent oxidoreductase, partial [Deltaproteobacteria bacterium]|nr:NAD(P)H-dependent oxidoreductase [Deltaproteobacteria bacterium]